MDIVYLLDRLEEVVSSARRVPFSSNVMLDRQECRDVVDQLKLAIPEELKLARRVIDERDRILADADQRAERVIQRAEEEATRRTEDHSLLQAVETRARSLIQSAEDDASTVRREADEYAYRVLASLQHRLRPIQDAIESSMQELSSERQARDAEEENPPS